MDLKDLKIDPEFEAEIPPLTEEEFNLLKQNILSEGRLLSPLIIWNRTIVDGHNRYRILLEHPEIEFKTFEKDFPDRFVASAWICKNQLGRRNLTPEQRIYLIGKQYASVKESRGGERPNSGANGPDGRFTAKCQNETLRLDESAGTKIAQDNNIARSTVIRAEQYAKGVDAADEALPGIRKELLSGSIKPTRDAVAAITRAAPEDRAGLAKRLRQPRAKPENEMPEETVSEDDEDPKDFKETDGEEIEPAEGALPIRVPKRSEILALAESMNHSEGQAIGTVEDMIYEMNSAMQDMIFRWNFCRETYTKPIKSRDGKKQIRDLAAEGIEYLKDVRKGALWKEEPNS